MYKRQVQNPYALVNRSADNGLDETLLRSGVGLLAYSPLLSLIHISEPTRPY